MTDDATSVAGSFEPVATSVYKSALLRKSPVNHARVDFSPFLPLRSKVDCIVITCKPSDREKDEWKLIKSSIKDGQVRTTRARKYWYIRGRDWFAVHDPSPRDLQYLVERFWNSRVMYMEFAVDAHLPPGSNDRHLLYELKGQLRHCLYPQAHARLTRAKRRHFDETVNLPKGRFRDDGLDTPLPVGSIIWEHSGANDQLGLYIKTKDNIKSKDDYDVVPEPWVRMEARLEDNGPKMAGLGRVGMLPHFAANLRTYLNPMFSVASGFKNADELVKRRGMSRDPWTKWGAQWTDGGKAVLKYDTDAQKQIGGALNELRRSLMRLKPPSAVAHRYDDWIKEMTP